MEIVSRLLILKYSSCTTVGKLRLHCHFGTIVHENLVQGSSQLPLYVCMFLHIQQECGSTR